MIQLKELEIGAKFATLKMRTLSKKLRLKKFLSAQFSVLQKTFPIGNRTLQEVELVHKVQKFCVKDFFHLR